MIQLKAIQIIEFRLRGGHTQPARIPFRVATTVAHRRRVSRQLADGNLRGADDRLLVSVSAVTTLNE